MDAGGGYFLVHLPGGMVEDGVVLTVLEGLVASVVEDEVVLGVTRVVVGCGGLVVLFGVELGNVVFIIPHVPHVFLHKLSRSSATVSH